VVAGPASNPACQMCARSRSDGNRASGHLTRGVRIPTRTIDLGGPHGGTCHETPRPSGQRQPV